MDSETILLDFIVYLNKVNAHTNIFFELKEQENSLILGTYVVDFFRSNEKSFYNFFKGLTKTQLDEVSHKIAEFATNRTLKTIISLNQYVQIENRIKQELYDLYDAFIHDLASLFLTSVISNEHLLLLVVHHQYQLRDILNTVEELHIFPKHMKTIHSVPCFEYSAEIQLSILGIHLNTILEPILDIGCGENAKLVHYLRDCGYETYGIDRSVMNCSYTFQKDWFDFELEKNSWGTIISHLSFTNHFSRNHLKKNSNSLSYAHKYMEILNSLKPGGEFYYTPDLPYIEQFLDNKSYQIRKKLVQTNETGSIQATRVRKLI